MSRTYRNLLPVELEALQAFANAHQNKRDLTPGCRSWKDELTDVYWYNARVWKDGPDPSMGNVLHAIRNEFGPEWLHDEFKLPK